MEKQIYDKLYEIEEKHWWFISKAEIVQYLIDKKLHLGDFGKKAKVLDVGCGTGAFLKNMSKKYDAYGTDTEALSIKYCARRGIKKVYRCTLDTFPKKSMRFDLITMLDVLEHIKDDNKALKQVHNYLRPGGALVLTVPAFEFLWTKHDEVHHHYRRYHKKQLESRLKKAGFTIKKLSYYNTILFPVALAERMVGKLTKKATPLNIPANPINSTLKFIFSSEKHFLNFMSFPYGVSLIAIAVKD